MMAITKQGCARNRRPEILVCEDDWIIQQVPLSTSLLRSWYLCVTTVCFHSRICHINLIQTSFLSCISKLISRKFSNVIVDSLSNIHILNESVCATWYDLLTILTFEVVIQHIGSNTFIAVACAAALCDNCLFKDTQAYRTLQLVRNRYAINEISQFCIFIGSKCCGFGLILLPWYTVRSRWCVLEMNECNKTAFSFFIAIISFWYTYESASATTRSPPGVTITPPVPLCTTVLGCSMTFKKLLGIPVVRFIRGCLSNSLSPFVGQLLIKWPIAKSKKQKCNQYKHIS